MVIPRAVSGARPVVPMEDTMPSLHRIYVRLEGDPRQIIGWVQPTMTGWRYVVLRGAWKLRVLTNGYMPRRVATVAAQSRAEAVASVRREWGLAHNLRASVTPE